MKNQQLLLNDIEAEIKYCRKCRLYEAACKGVPGEGAPAAEILFIGEAPGKNEDLSGRPFVGSAGKFLDSMLAGIGLGRADVFIANIVKHRPPKNRAPRPDEIMACTPYLDSQIKVIKPKIIIPMGQHATDYILSRTGADFQNISAARGKLYERVLLDRQVIIMPIYHPAASLYSPKYKAAIKEDFQKIQALIQGRFETAV